MCGRYSASFTPEELRRRFELPDFTEHYLQPRLPRFNVAPTDLMPVVVERTAGRWAFRQDPRMTLPDEQVQAFDDALAALASFKRTFGRALNEGFVPELHAARVLGLRIVAGVNAAGFDAVDEDGARYQIKLRRAQNVDLDSFGFDDPVLVALDDD